MRERVRHLGLYPIVILFCSTSQPRYTRFPIIFSSCFSKAAIGYPWRRHEQLEGRRLQRSHDRRELRVVCGRAAAQARRAHRDGRGGAPAARQGCGYDLLAEGLRRSVRFTYAADKLRRERLAWQQRPPGR
jgi:hypothetical protein